MNALILDTELTGFNNPEVIEAAWYRFDGEPDLSGTNDRISLRVAGSMNERFQPDGKIETGAMAVHHIIPSDLTGCRPSREFALPDGVDYLIGHTIDTDWKAIGCPDVKRIDTHGMCQWLWPDADSFSLGAMVYWIDGATDSIRGIVRKSHGALQDTWMTYHLLGKILQKNPDIDTWVQLWEYSEQCRIPRTCPFRNRKGVLLEDLEDDYIDWCLEQDWIDPYLRKGLERVVTERYGSPDALEIPF